MATTLSEKIRTRRDRLYIIADVLNLAKDGIPKTQIMYKANLSFAQLNEYLAFLLETKLIASTTQNGKTVYKVTSKGMRYLRNYAKVTPFLKINGKHTVESHPALNHVDEAAQPEKASYVVTPSLENVISRVGDIDTRLRLLETSLSDLLSKNLSFQYCPYCGKEIKPRDSSE